VLSSEARARLARVAIVRPETARAVEDHLLKLARSGALREVVSEALLIRLLEQVGGGSGGGAGEGGVGRVVIRRKKGGDDDDEDDDGDL